MVQAERLAAVGQTIATLSHHIKNILQGIRGGSYLIEMGLSAHDEAVVRKGWEMVERNQNKISALVHGHAHLQQGARARAGARRPEQVVGEVVELMQARAAELDVALDWTGAGHAATCLFDPEGMHRAVLNMVTNAIDACEKQPGGRVRASTAHGPAEAMLRVVVEDRQASRPRTWKRSSRSSSRKKGAAAPAWACR